MIGIIGGNGVAATNKLCELVEELYTLDGAFRDAHHPEILVWQATQAPSRSMYFEGRGESFIDDYVRIGCAMKNCGVAARRLKLEGNFAREISLEQGLDLAAVHALADGPHELGHGGFGCHVPALDHAQVQQLLAHLIDLQIGGIVQALGGDHHADVPAQGRADAVQALVEDIDTAQAEGLDDDALVAHDGEHLKNPGVQARGQLQQEDIVGNGGHELGEAHLGLEGRLVDDQT